MRRLLLTVLLVCGLFGASMLTAFVIGRSVQRRWYTQPVERLIPASEEPEFEGVLVKFPYISASL